jgi:TatA/E family protein of Tat protein translocase
VFGTLGMPELILIFVVALLLFGPRKMPEIGKSIGRAMGEFRRASNEFKRTIEDEVAAEDIREVEKDLKEDLKEITRVVKDPIGVSDLKESVKKSIDAPPESRTGQPGETEGS